MWLGTVFGLFIDIISCFWCDWPLRVCQFHTRCVMMVLSNGGKQTMRGSDLIKFSLEVGTIKAYHFLLDL